MINSENNNNQPENLDNLDTASDINSSIVADENQEIKQEEIPKIPINLGVEETSPETHPELTELTEIVVIAEESSEKPSMLEHESIIFEQEISSNEPLNIAQDQEATTNKKNLESSSFGLTDLAIQLAEQVGELQQQEKQLKHEIADLQAQKILAQQEYLNSQNSIGSLVQEALTQLENRKQGLLIEVEKLERRRERIQKEMRTSFAGVSQDLAIRVQGFKDYLVGSLQDLAATAEQLELAPLMDEKETPKIDTSTAQTGTDATMPRFAEQAFQDQIKQIKIIINQYRNSPDYYGPPWQLRRTFEPVHADKLSNWFFTQGGRGALRTMGSRLQNILIGSAAVSVLRSVYGSRLQTLVLANTPERLGEWRRGLQDCLGISRNDFGPDRGVVLFEEAEPVSQRADRLVKDGKLPLILIDETEDKISLSLLQFPLWLVFAPDPQIVTPKERDFSW